MIMAAFCGLLLTMIAGSVAGQIRNQGDLNAMARSLGVKFEVLTNIDADYEFDIKITLTNHDSRRSLDYGTWGIFFTHIFSIQAKNISSSPTRSVELDDGQWLLTQYQGSLFSLKPVHGFSKIKPGAKNEILLKASPWSVSRWDSMPNWYMAAPGLNAVVIKATEDGNTLPFAAPRDSPAKWKRYKHDLFNPYSPEVRYKKNFIDFSSHRPTIGIIPRPLKVETTPDKKLCIANSQWTIYYDGSELRQEAMFLKGKMSGITVQSSGGSYSKGIMLKIGNVATGDKVLKGSEAYSLKVDATSEKITIISKSRTGVFYGIMSLLSVLENNCAPQTSIHDGPRFPYRGVMLDIARNFQSADHIIEVIKVMASYKLNKLHLHLTDDEGWRLEVPALPELTELGSKRCHDLEEKKCLLPQIGSKLSKRGEYLTTEDYKRILKAAQDHHIEVIPEIDMPGHARAAIKSMELRMSNTPHARPDVSLREQGDTSDYTSVQMYKDNAINPCLESTYNFVEIVMDHLIDLHKSFGGLKVFHMGVDEVKKTAYTNSTTCNRLISEGKLTSETHKQYFVKRVEKMATGKGLTPAVWEDGALEPNHEPMDRSNNPKPFMAYAWNSVWEWWTAHRTYKLANAGHKVVMTHASFLYFDHPQEPDPEEQGYYWAARFTNTKKVFSYDAIDFYANIKTRLPGTPITKEEKCKTTGPCVTLTKRENIIGMQASLFGEEVRTKKMLHERLFPRLLAFADRAWHQADWEGEAIGDAKTRKIEKDWKDFVYTVGKKEFPRLRKNGMSFWIPPPGAKIENGNLKTTTLYPGLQIEISDDANGPWTSFQDGDKVPYTCDFWMRSKFPGSGVVSRAVMFDLEE